MSYEVESILYQRMNGGHTDQVMDRRLVGSPQQGWIITFLNNLIFCQSRIQAYLHLHQLKLINTIIIL